MDVDDCEEEAIGEGASKCTGDTCYRCAYQSDEDDDAMPISACGISESNLTLYTMKGNSHNKIILSSMSLKSVDQIPPHKLLGMPTVKAAGYLCCRNSLFFNNHVNLLHNYLRMLLQFCHYLITFN